MKAKPDNWEGLNIERKVDHVLGKDTSVCNCTPTLGEDCDRCKDLPDIKEEDRNYHEELLLMLRHLTRESRKPEIYSIFETLIKLDDEETFNKAFRYEFVENMGTGEHAMENAFCAYHKTLRQYDHYNHLQITDTKKKDFVSSGCFQSILYDFIHMSEVPYQMMKKLLTL